MKKILYKLPRFALSAAVITTVLYLTLFPRPLGDSSIPMFPGADKLVHGLMFWAVAAGLCVDFGRVGAFLRRGAAFVAGMGFWLSSAIGGVVEIAQWKMDIGRSGDWLDFAADIVGASVGVVMAMRMLKLKKEEA